MAFLYPAFLFGLLALAIPVLIHLFRFKRFKTVYFSNVSFLESVYQENQAKSKLKHYLLLAARMLAFLFLVFAFAGPYIDDGEIKQKYSGATTSIFLDNSLSMQGKGKTQALLSEAKQVSYEIINALPESNELYVITNQLSAKSRYPLSKQEALYSIQETNYSSQNKSLKDLIDIQRSYWEEMPKDIERRYFVISDFRTNYSFNGISLDSNERVVFVPLEPSNAKNSSIDSVWIESPFIQLGAPISLHYRLKRNANTTEELTKISVKLNGEDFLIFSQSWNKRTVVDSVVNITLPKAKTIQLEISISDNGLTYDNMKFGVLNLKEEITILELTEEKKNSGAQRAFGTDSIFQFQSISPSQVTDEILNAADVILYTSNTSISNGLLAKLLTLANSGIKVGVFPTEKSSESIKNAFQNQGLSIYSLIDSSSTFLDGIDTNIPFFADLFAKEPENASWPKIKSAVQFSNSIAFQNESLLKGTDGKALMKRLTYGKGQIYVSTFSIGAGQSGLLKHPIFLPILFKLATYSEDRKPLYYEVGNTKRITTSLNPNEQGNFTIIGEQDGVEFIPEVIPTAGNFDLTQLSTVEKSGFYTIEGEQNTSERMAFNYSNTESATNYLSEDSLEFLALENGISIQLLNTEKIKTGDLSGTFGEPQSLWRICLLLTLLFLTAEVLITRFMT